MSIDSKLSHIDDQNNPAMVDVSGKVVTSRMARARAVVHLGSKIVSLLEDGEINTKKGPVFQTAIIAGTMAAKKTGDLIPLCHPLGIESCKFQIKVAGDDVIIDCTTTISSKTGVEMEALTGASLAALTIYDMCKAMSHDITIREIKLMEKKGGKNDYIRK
ncbi:MAG: cyclic pyranopterin monophosphate synthase MoaC [Bacteroidetes bacterium]|nr:cyclic pyranopterin monophosphate synthase MoaC [Bacteroidota bacterium]MDA1120367.1 cyclic pyranopterin monophosphate synthase MoaC [Bacteroidota bacterium]